MKNSTKVIIFILIALVAIFAISSFMDDMTASLEIAYDGSENSNGLSLKHLLETGKVDAMYVVGYKVYILRNDLGQTGVPAKYFPSSYDNYAIIPSSARLQEDIYVNWDIDAIGVDMPNIIYADPSEGSILWDILPIIGFVGVIVVMFIFFRQAQGSNNKAMGFGKTKARLVANTKVRFADVAGAEEEKAELKEIVEFLKSPRKFTELGARIPKGVLLVGPPGTGKTLFAKAVAGEAGVPFFSISGSDFVEMFVGVGASRVRDMFDQAKRSMPCIVFIDEIDAVGRQRGAGLGGGNDEREQTLNQLLVEMDGFEANQSIIVMAATNRADVLDPALLRPGRFDRQIYVNVPDVAGREAIFRVHTRNKPLAADVDFKVLARMTSGFSGADIENLLNEAAILAARANRKVITMEDALEGINKVIAGPRKVSRVVTEADKRITAYHEAGHAIIAKLMKHCDEVQEVSIIPRGMAAGYTLTRPDSDDSHVSKNKLIETITMMLGGRAAEQIVIKDISTGASNDIQRASGIARRMVAEWGMSDKIGNFYLGGDQEVFLGRDFTAHNSYSEEFSALIDSEVKAIIDSAYANAINILTEKRSVLDNMVRVLFEKETIFTAEVDALMEGKTAEEVCAMMDAKKDVKPDNAKNNLDGMIVPEKKEEVKPESDKAADENAQNE